jgi:hypothetical protein
MAGGAVCFYTATLAPDISTTSLSTSRTLFALPVPTGVKMGVDIRTSYSASATVIVASPDEPDTAPAFSTGPLFDGYANGAFLANRISGIITDTSAQIAARASGAGTALYGSLVSYTDFRR